MVNAWIYVITLWLCVGLYFVYLTAEKRNPYYAELWAVIGLSLIPVVNSFVLGNLIYKLGNLYLKIGIPEHMKPKRKLELFK
jgi:hypothetical protein